MIELTAGYAQSITMYKQCLLQVKHRPEVNHKLMDSESIAGSKYN